MSPDKLTMDVAALKSLPFADRMDAYDDFDRAVEWWSQARKDRAFRRLDMRRALRAWQRYARAVRKARDMRIAA